MPFVIVVSSHSDRLHDPRYVSLRLHLRDMAVGDFDPCLPPDFRIARARQQFRARFADTPYTTVAVAFVLPDDDFTVIGQNPAAWPSLQISKDEPFP
jgi:hypothetical protein